MVLSVIGFILFLICVRIFIALNPFPKLVRNLQSRKEKRSNRQESKDHELGTLTPMITPFPIVASAPIYPKITNNETQKNHQTQC